MTIQNNKLIAIFMGGKTSDMNNRIVKEHQNIWLPIYGICDWSTINLSRGKILQYHKSWDWLMQVVEKCESLDNTTVIIQEESCIINHYQRKNRETFGKTKIEATYKAVVEFINWYNENKINKNEKSSN